MTTTPEQDPILMRMRQETETNAQNNLLGPETAGETLANRIQYQDDSIIQSVGRAVAETPIPTVFNWAVRQAVEDDPDFKLRDDEIKQIQEAYPQRSWSTFAGVRSATELELLKQDIEEEMEDEAYLAETSGIQSFLATGIAATVDPINYLPLKASYLGYKASNATARLGARVQGVAYGAAAGVEATALSVGITEGLSPTGNTDEVIPALAFGLAFGGGAGAAGAFDDAIRGSVKKFVDDYPAQKKTSRSTSDDFNQTANLPLEVREGGWFATVKEALTPDPKLKATGVAQQGTDAGARAAPGNVQDLANTDLPSEDLLLVSRARKMNEANEITDEDLALKGHPIGNWMYNQVQKVPFLRTLSDIGYNSGSAIHRMLSFQTLNNAAGIANNVESVGMLGHKQEMNIGGPVLQALRREYPNWLKENGLKRSRENYRAFNRAVQRYDHEIYMNGKATSTSKALEAVHLHGEKTASTGREWLMDTKYGKSPVRGAENLDDSAGWRPLRWTYSEMQRVMRKHGLSEADLVDSLVNGYRKVHTWMDDDALKIWAKAVVRRSRAMDGGIDTNLIRFLDQDGEAYAKQVLIDSGISEDKANRLVKALQDRKPAENTVKILQKRNEIDLNTPIGSTGATLMDLTDPDLGSVWSSYSRTAAYSGAQARWGLQKGDLRKLLDAGNRELVALGKEPMKAEHIEFWERALNGQAMNKVNPWVRRMTMASNLSLMSSQGLTQLADTGAAVAQFGGKVYLKALAETIKKVDTPALRELARVNKSIDGEHNFKLTEKQMDDWSKDANFQREFEKHLDAALVKGGKIQAIWSGFEAIHKGQHEIVARAYLHQFGDMAKGKTKLTEARLADMGFSGPRGRAMYQKIMKNFDPNTGIVKYDADGDVFDLNVSAWDEADFDFFAATQQHVSHQLTMQLMRGETMPWQANGDFGALLSNLRGYTLAAISKQTIRHSRIMDPVATATWMYTFLSALTVVSARDAINGKEESMSMEDRIRSAIGLGSMTGGPSMLPDLLGGLLGMDSLQVSAYRTEGPAGIRVLPELIAFNQMEKMLHIPVSMFNVATGGFDKQDISSMQSLPIIGNLYGFTWMFNGMKQYVDERRAAEKAAKKQAKETPPKPEKPPEPEPQPEPKDTPKPKTGNKQVQELVDTGKKQELPSEVKDLLD